MKGCYSRSLSSIVFYYSRKKILDLSDIRLFSNKRANAWHARVTLISFDGVTFTAGGGKERKKKYKILGAESSASVDGGGGGNCWIRVEGEEVEHTKLFFFFFFSKCRRYKTWNTNVPREHNRHNDPNFYANRSYALFFPISLCYTHAVSLFSLLNGWGNFSKLD